MKISLSGRNSRSGLIGLICLSGLFVLLLTGCQPNPIDVADGERIKIEAQTAALAADQERVFLEQEHALKMVNDQAAAFQYQQFLRGLLRVGTVFGSIALAFGLLGAGAGASIAAVGTGQAVSKAANFKALMVYADVRTGMFPQFVQLVHEGPAGKKWALADPNTRSSILLDVKNVSDAQSIVNAGYIAAAGVMSRNARITVNQGESSPFEPPEIPLVLEGVER